MRNTRHSRFKLMAMSGCAAVALATAAYAREPSNFDVPGGDLKTALVQFAGQSNQEILFSTEIVAGRRTSGVSAQVDAPTALAQLLRGTGLTFQQTDTGTLLVVRADADPQGGSAAGSGAEVEALIVTAQKREEDIQDVPIAMSAFTQEALEKSQVAGGADLMTQVPNMTFTKTNFSGYSIQIRGIGTQAISATTDPAVAVAFNNTPFIHNRFFEQEFYDLQRVEVLRGPQGTLYGRNATAGVVNIISAKPKFSYEAKLSGDIGNYNATRLEGMVNIPLVEDKVAMRLAGAWTKREGYATNQMTGNPIDGRDMWSTRLSLRFAPSDTLDVNFIWEHFEEDDDRIRSGKQLCKKDTRSEINGVPIPFNSGSGQNASPAAVYNQGCVPASLYAPESFQTPNGFSLPYYHPLREISLPTVAGLDPYANATQSRDLRVIESSVDPEYRAKSDVAELQVSWDISDYLTVQSETAYNADEVFSTQDYNRFTTSPGAFDQNLYNIYSGVFGTGGLYLALGKDVLKGGVFCDPQLGCSDRILAVDLSTAQSTQFSQEFRLSSDYDSPLNFSLGANFTRFDTENKYYVFFNTLNLYTALRKGYGGQSGPTYVPGVSSNIDCLGGPLIGDPNVAHPVEGCVYMDPNPIDSLNDQGHNYFLSKNPYRLISYAVFGELYYNISDNLKITGGLRYTVDKKHAPVIPSWLLAEGTYGYPVKEILDVEWSEPTGRLAIDWKPDFSFTDETLLYASYAHGYKAGGANPPPMIVVVAGSLDGVREEAAESVLHPKTFDAEFVDAFELGAKNTVFDGRVTFNASAFYYDYTGYQISQILDRSAVNSNFDAEIWGLEIEADWRPLENLRIGFKGGYENTRIADGMEAIDLMDRTAGHVGPDGKPDWVVAKPFPSLASNCIIPVYVATWNNQIHTQGGNAPGAVGMCVQAYVLGHDPGTEQPYIQPTVPTFAGWAGYTGFDPSTAPNGGAGFTKDLSGNELPNAPHYTGTLTADYTVPLSGDWIVNLHADLYYQSEAWTRIFNTEGYDKLKAYTNVNLAAIFTNEDAGWRVMAYVKNVMDRDSITGAFLNSDDSGLTTNVFLTEPRLYGVRVTKDFSGAPLLGGLFETRAEPGEPYPFTIEIGGGAARYSGDVENYAPDWVDIYSATFGPVAIDDEELDWGDTREVKTTYAGWKDWRISAGYRFGKTNGGDRKAAYEHVPGGIIVGFFFESYSPSDDNHWVGTVQDHEEFAIVDFMVGHDFGFGLLGDGGKSMLSAGLRYAELSSLSFVEMDGIPNRIVPARASFLPMFGLPNRRHIQYTSSLDSDRGFEGIGPSLAWDASIRLFGDGAGGQTDLDWSVGGGVLFGEQTVDSLEDRLAREFELAQFFPTTTHYDDAVPRHRTEDVTVPNLSLSLGVSYAIDRVKVSTGYSYDRFFDAIDGGYKDSQTFDRTIHGPYLKLSVGFGG